jgi:hypothetical protein
MSFQRQAEREIMKRRSVLFLVFLLVISQWTVWGQKAKPKAPAGRPSLDLLVSRVGIYWNLLLERKRANAAQYVISSEREKFMDRAIARFENPKIKSLLSLDDKSGVKVTVMVKRNTSFGIMDWPVTEQWVFKNGNWFLQPSQETVPGLDQQISKIEQKDARKTELFKKLRIERSTLDFGLVKKGTEVSMKLKYSLDGNEALVAWVDKSTQDLTVEGFKSFRLQPGKSMELTVKLPTQKYEGIVQESIALKAKEQDTEVEFKIAVQGFVYVPVSADPQVVRLNPEKEMSEKEILVRNNASSSLVLQSFSSPSGAIEVEDLPLTIPPHQQGSIKVRQVQKAAHMNLSESLMITFAEPVEDWRSLTISIVLDASNTTDGVIYDPLNDPKIQEQVRRNLLNNPKLPNR